MVDLRNHHLLVIQKFIGLYNDRRELLAVAKLSKPLLKSFTREALIKVKLDF